MIGLFSSKFLLLVVLPFYLLADAPADEGSSQIYSVISVGKGGSPIELSDNNVYEVSYPDRLISKQWGDAKTIPAQVQFVNSKNPNFDYPLVLQNVSTNQSIQVRHPKIVIDSTIEAPSEEDDSD